MNGTFVTNLHSLWDSGLLSLRLRRDFPSNNTRYYEYLRELMLKQSPADNDNSIDQWIAENIKFVCERIYLNENNATMNTSTNFTLGEIYYQRHISLVEQRLAQGGRRLGALLNRLAKHRPKPPREELCVGTIVLIAVLATEAVLVIAVGLYLCYRCRKSSSRRLSSAPKAT